MSSQTISIVTAFYNEAQNLPLFRERVTDLLAALPHHGEIVLVDDHSNDDSSRIAKDWAGADDRVRYIRLSRNCGSHAAFSAGLAHSTGDCAVLLAADLQDPPEMVPQLVEHWHAGSDVVWAVRLARQGESWTTKTFAAASYWLMRRVALPEMPAGGADFLLVDRKVIDAYCAIAEKNTSILAMILWMGFRQSFVPYVKQARHAGKSKWTLTKKFKLFVDSMASFSYAPIRWMSLFGFATALAGFLYATFVIVARLAGWIATGTGFAALMTVVLTGQGITMMMLGVLGEYLWRTYDEARRRPRYIVEENVSMADESSRTTQQSTLKRAA
ncbi:MAG TPA: glycosyltransferase family 2 protein [Lacipirellulaceae bacterium]|nr:glycosyltransferase family 2 protein [Lacipirellulaceae bacterium]